MAFTTVSRVLSIDKGDWSHWQIESPYFYPEDISAVLNQTFKDQDGILHPMVSLQCIIVEAKNEDESATLTSLALIGLWYHQQDKIYVRFDHSDALLALPCGRENDRGGIFKNELGFKTEYKDINPKVRHGPDPHQF